MVALDLEDLEIWLKIGNLGMIRFMLTTFLKIVCMMGDYLEGDTNSIVFSFF
jgi:hypothetical protein